MHCTRRYDLAFARAWSGRQHRSPLVHWLHRGHGPLRGRVRRGAHRELRATRHDLSAECTVYSTIQRCAGCSIPERAAGVLQASWWVASSRASCCSRATAGGGRTYTRRSRCSSWACTSCSRTPSSSPAAYSPSSYAAHATHMYCTLLLGTGVQVNAACLQHKAITDHVMMLCLPKHLVTSAVQCQIAPFLSSVCNSWDITTSNLLWFEDAIVTYLLVGVRYPQVHNIDPIFTIQSTR